MSFSRRRRREELEEVKEPLEGNNMVDKARADSVNSDGWVKEKTVSWGVKVSRTDCHCTLSRTVLTKSMRFCHSGRLVRWKGFRD